MWYHLILLLVLHQELIYIYHFLSICTTELISTPEIITFISLLLSVNKGFGRELNPML